MDKPKRKWTLIGRYKVDPDDGHILFKFGPGPWSDLGTKSLDVVKRYFKKTDPSFNYRFIKAK